MATTQVAKVFFLLSPQRELNRAGWKGGGGGRGPGYMATLDRLHLVLRNTSKYFGLYHVAVVSSFLRSQISLAVI